MHGKYKMSQYKKRRNNGREGFLPQYEPTENEINAAHKWANDNNYRYSSIREMICDYRTYTSTKRKTKGREKSKGLSCDVELGGIGDTMKYGTILLVGGILTYAMWKFNLFGGLRWLKDAARDLYKAPETIAKWTDAEIGTRVDQIDKIFNVLKIKGDNFSVDYGNINNEWQKLKQKAVASYGKESYKKTFYESGKEYYFGGKASKEKLMDELDKFKTKPLHAMRILQSKKGFKISGNWQIIGNLNCIPCLF